MPLTSADRPAPRIHPGSDLGLQAPEAEIFVPDGLDPLEALARCTHFAIGAHPDDLEVLALPGIEACYEDAEAWFGGVVVTDGVGGPARDLGEADLGGRRREEQRTAAQVGRYGAVVQLGRSSATVKDRAAAESVVEDLTRLLDGTRPDTLWLHNPADRHDTHVAVLLRTLEAVRRLPPSVRPRTAYGVEFWRDLDWLSGDDRVELPVGRHPHLARALIGCYGSQIESGKRYDLAVEARATAHATFADSHAVDGTAGLRLAIDLSACLRDGGPTAAERIEQALSGLRQDVHARLKCMESDR